MSYSKCPIYYDLFGLFFSLFLFFVLIFSFLSFEISEDDYKTSFEGESFAGVLVINKPSLYKLKLLNEILSEDGELTYFDLSYISFLDFIKDKPDPLSSLKQKFIYDSSLILNKQTVE